MKSKNSEPEIAPLTPQAAYANLVEAERLRRAGDLARAQALCEALLARHPGYVGALQTLGAIHLARGNGRGAFGCLSEAALLCPDDAATLDSLAKACMAGGGTRMAALFLREASRVQPDDIDLNWSLAHVQREQRDYGSAAVTFEKILKALPASADAAHGLGECLVQLGRFDEAAPALLLAHRLEPSSAAILYSLSQLPAASRNVDLVAALAKVRPQKNQDNADFDMLRTMTMAAAQHQRGDHVAAWTNLTQARTLAAPVHAEAFRKQEPFMVAALEAARAFIPAHASVSSASVPLVLFILGPSRSGKSILERLAAAVLPVRRGHESRLVERATRRASQLAGLLTTDNPLDLPSALDQRLAENFASTTGSLAAGSCIVTDTYPAMIPYAGKAAAVLPNVRFVFMSRNPHDSALRILLRQYRAGNHYAYDVRTVFEYLRWYDAMAQAWLEKLPGMSLAVSYEDMVADPAGTVANVARLCGMTPADRPLPATGDDRGCALAYHQLMDEALSG